MVYTNHAIKRMQQRGININTVEILCSYGSEQSDKHGANIIYIDNKALEQIRRFEPLNMYKHLNEKPIYAIERKGLIITVGHRYKKIYM